MASIGHQTGLFRTLATSGPATSAQVAEAGGLNEQVGRSVASVAGAVASWFVDQPGWC
jgi:hypothetical protein